MKTKACILLLIGILFFVNTKVNAQKEYAFASTGQQKLILNPSFAGSSKGLNIQTLYASSYANSIPVSQSYFGADYGFKNGLGVGLSFTKHDYNSKLYASNQIDLSGAYKIKLRNNITIVPSLQFSYLQWALDLTKSYFVDVASANNGSSPYRYADMRGVVDISQPKFIWETASLSSGFIMNINDKITFGLSMFDINEPMIGFHFIKRDLTQIYHVSGILFRDKPVSLQPYSVLKLQHYNEQYWESGFYTTYKMLSLQTAVRPRFDYTVGNIASLHSTFFGIISGINLAYKKCKFGYTFKSLNSTFKYSAHELFFSAKLSNSETKADRALFID